MAITLKYKDKNGNIINFTTKKLEGGEIELSGFATEEDRQTGEKKPSLLKETLPEEEVRMWIKAYKDMAERGYGTITITQKKE